MCRSPMALAISRARARVDPPAAAAPERLVPIADDDLRPLVPAFRTSVGTDVDAPRAPPPPDWRPPTFRRPPPEETP